MPAILTPFLQMLYVSSGPIQHLGVPHKDVNTYFRGIIYHDTLSIAFRTILDNLSEEEFKQLYIELCIEHNISENNLKDCNHFRFKALLKQAVISLVINPFLDITFINISVTLMIDPNREFYEVVIGAKPIRYSKLGNILDKNLTEESKALSNHKLVIATMYTDINESDFLEGKMAIPCYSNWLEAFTKYYDRRMPSTCDLIRKTAYGILTKSLKIYGATRQFDFNTISGTSLHGWLINSLKSTQMVGSKRKASVLH